LLELGDVAFEGDHNRLLDDPPTAEEELAKMTLENRANEVARMKLQTNRAQYFNTLRAELDKKGLPYYKVTLVAGTAGIQDVWRNEGEKVDPTTSKKNFSHLKFLNYYGGGKLSNTSTTSEDLPTDAKRMQAKMDSYYPLDPRTADKIVLSTYPTLAARCLDTYVKIGDMDVLLKRGQKIKERFGIGDAEYEKITEALETGVVPEGLTPIWKYNVPSGT
jgi:hypothetical protein